MEIADWIMLGVLAFCALMSVAVAVQDHRELRRQFPNNPALW